MDINEDLLACLIDTQNVKVALKPGEDVITIVIIALEQRLREDLFCCLHYYNSGKELWRSIRTTNILERATRQVRRRTRSMNNFFTNEASAERVMYGIADMLNANWKGNTLKPISAICWTRPFIASR